MEKSDSHFFFTEVKRIGLEALFIAHDDLKIKKSNIFACNFYRKFRTKNLVYLQKILWVAVRDPCFGQDSPAAGV